MFELHSLLLFISAGLLLNLTPGPDVLYIVARSTGQGRQAGIVSVLGISAGCLVHIVAAAAGLSALMMALPAAYEVMRYLGAAYLVFLGLRKLFTRRARVVASGVLPAQSLRRIFWQGVLIMLPVSVLGIVSLASLRRDEQAAEQDARQRAAENVQSLARAMRSIVNDELHQFLTLQNVWTMELRSSSQPSGNVADDADP